MKSTSPDVIGAASGAALLTALRDHAADPRLPDLLDARANERTWARVGANSELELWLIGWPPGARTDWHDHGSASGAFTVLRGSLVEHSLRSGLESRRLEVGEARIFGVGHAHDVRNDGVAPALSLHAYSPRLSTMTRYRLRGRRLEALGVETAGVQW